MLSFSQSIDGSHRQVPIYKVGPYYKSSQQMQDHREHGCMQFWQRIPTYAYKTFEINGGLSLSKLSSLTGHLFARCCPASSNISVEYISSRMGVEFSNLSGNLQITSIQIQYYYHSW